MTAQVLERIEPPVLNVQDIRRRALDEQYETAPIALTCPDCMTAQVPEGIEPPVLNVHAKPQGPPLLCSYARAVQCQACGEGHNCLACSDCMTAQVLERVEPPVLNVQDIWKRAFTKPEEKAPLP